MKKKTICDANLNSLVANAKADKAIKAIRRDYPSFLTDETVATEMQLRKLTMREPHFDVPAGKPLYAFAKRAGKKLTILVELTSGKAEIVPTATIDSTAPVNGKFTIDGVKYELKDTMNGCPRYRACGSEHKSRAKAQLKRQLKDIANEFLKFRFIH